MIGLSSQSAAVVTVLVNTGHCSFGRNREYAETTVRFTAITQTANYDQFWCRKKVVQSA